LNEENCDLQEHSLPEFSRDMRIAGILDELSERFFPFECQFVNLDYNCWEEQIKQHNPHLLFVESIWNGYKKTWRGNFTQTNNLELKRLINWCNERNIPTVFWNKEDPIHIFTFLGIASLFDFVFTTDLDCVPLYKRLLGHNNVGVLPFATAIQLFNPIEKFERKEAACFAGSYYAKREERRKDFDRIADDLVNNYQLEIYDRNPYPGNPDYSFPKRFQPLIKGSLPVEKIDIAYKSYKVGVTLNIVKYSSTMEARRVFELLGCNTLTVTNPCLGIKNLFGNLVIQNEDDKLFQKRIKEIVTDENYANRVRLLGLRKILMEHTYKERVSYLYEKCLGVKPKKTEKEVTVFSIVRNIDDIEYVKTIFNNQSYSSKRLFLFTSSNNLVHNSAFQDTYPIEEFYSILTGQTDFYAFLSTRNHYGKNYLLDLMLSFEYANTSAIGKSAHFQMQENKNEFIEELGAYQLIDQLQIDRCVFMKHLLPLLTTESFSKSKSFFECVPCLSVDPYNFCEGARKKTCPEVDDLDIESGISIQELYAVSDSLTSRNLNYSEGFQLKSSDLAENATGKNLAKQVYHHPLNYFCVFTQDGSNRKILVNKKIKIKDFVSFDELTNKTVLNVFVNGIVSGNVNCYIEFYTSGQVYLSKYLVYPNSCTTLPVPDSSETCQFTLHAQGLSQCIIKEVLIGPKLISSIKLSKEKS
jgi:spore maturation protein CgeB